MIYTASFFEPENFGPGRLVSIAIEMPDSFVHLYRNRDITVNELLQPVWNMEMGKRAAIMRNKEYKRQYFNLLKRRLGYDWPDLRDGRYKPWEALILLELQDEDTLLCWEEYGKYCHRIMVAELLKKNGIQVERK